VARRPVITAVYTLSLLMSFYKMNV